MYQVIEEPAVINGQIVILKRVIPVIQMAEQHVYIFPTYNPVPEHPVYGNNNIAAYHLSRMHRF